MNTNSRVNPPAMLLSTKFYRPSLPGDFVDRQRLNDQLTQGLTRRLLLVSAPAGFGKSVLVSSWLGACAWPNAWLALDESTGHLSVFLSYFLAAVRTIAPDAALRTADLLTGFELPPLEVLTGSLINDLDAIEQDFILVLEDYHTVHADPVHRLVAALLRESLPHMHLVLITRYDPPLNLGVMRAHDIMTEVRLQALRFTVQEAAVFLEKMLGDPLPAPIVTELVEKCEGWIAGLRLAGLALHHRPDKGGHPPLLVGIEHNRYVSEYLMSEVLARAPARQRDFLIRTAVVERMCAGVCNAVCSYDPQDASGNAGLDWLEQNNLFVISLDMEHHWYRYHHLLRSFLLRELERHYHADEIAQLHSRASAWFAAHGMLEDAIRHALQGSDPQQAIGFIAEHRHKLMDTEQWQLLPR